MALISCKNLSVGYDKSAVLNGLSFEVNQGDYLCIVGENGSGKTTLMKTILGLQSPLQGEIEYSDGLNKNEIGYLPQQIVVQRDFPASVFEIVLSGNLSHNGLKPFYSKAQKLRAQENLGKLGISDLSKRCYRELSGGQQQRVLLARALCATEKLILLDEPVSGLDPKVTAEMYSIIRELNSQGIAVIMISHDINAALNYCSHILHIGDTVFFGTKQEYLKSPLADGFISSAGGENI